MGEAVTVLPANEVLKAGPVESEVKVRPPVLKVTLRTARPFAAIVAKSPSGTGPGVYVKPLTFSKRLALSPPIPASVLTLTKSTVPVKRPLDASPIVRVLEGPLTGALSSGPNGVGVVVIIGP